MKARYTNETEWMRDYNQLMADRETVRLQPDIVRKTITGSAPKAPRPGTVQYSAPAPIRVKP